MGRPRDGVSDPRVLGRREPAHDDATAASQKATTAHAVYALLRHGPACVSDPLWTVKPDFKGILTDVPYLINTAGATLIMFGACA